ncbi:MAG: hypothetical protein ACOWWM_01835 [Desulfobacterales bacterium]
MNWKFWKKNESTPSVSSTEPRLPKPQDLPQRVGQYLVVDRQMDPDLVWSLKSVLMPVEGSKSRFYIRIYNQSDIYNKGISVKNYHSLDDHADLIILAGTFDKATGALSIAPPMQKAG